MIRDDVRVKVCDATHLLYLFEEESIHYTTYFLLPKTPQIDRIELHSWRHPSTQSRLQFHEFQKNIFLLIFQTVKIWSISGLWGEIRSWEDGTTIVQKTHDANKHHVQTVRKLNIFCDHGHIFGLVTKNVTIFLVLVSTWPLCSHCRIMVDVRFWFWEIHMMPSCPRIISCTQVIMEKRLPEITQDLVSVQKSFWL